MGQKLTLSVVVPVYNEADQLAACLDALLINTRDVVEIIIVDNNSSDGSLEIAQAYADNYSKIRLLEEKSQGLIPTRNRGFLAANGDIIARIDADTRVEPGWALAILEYFGKNPGVAAITGETRYYDLPFERFSAGLSSFIVGNCNRAVSGFASLYGPNMALKANLAKWLSGISCHGSDINEDLDLTIHLTSAGLVTGYVPAMLAYISGRRMKSNPVNFYRYTLNWPRTFLRHKRFFAAGKAFALASLFCLGQALIFLPARAYDYERPAFSWRYMRGYGEDRIIP